MMMEPVYHSIRFGNGTTALWAALNVLGCRDTFIAVPSTICPSVICAIFASGNRPYFVDIERKRFGLDPALLPDVLPHVSAVIAVHALGIPCEIVAISELCKESGIPLIEDCCQAQGAEYERKPTGQFGDVAMFSFGAGKITEAGGGGALQTKNATVAEKTKALADALPALDDKSVTDLSLFYKFFYNQFYPDRLQYYQSMFTEFLRGISARLLGRYTDELDGAINEGFRKLANNIHDRRIKAAFYARTLAGLKDVEVLSFPEGSVPWRFNIHLDFPVRQFILKRMLAEGSAISSWSPDISQFMDCSSYKATSLANSKWLGDGILNLWLNDGMDQGAIADACSQIRNLLAEYRNVCDDSSSQLTFDAKQSC
jgi:dTDP-4-amino-4,6-dideoxygalactose transaminase